MALDERLVGALAELLGSRFSQAPSERDLHGRDESAYEAPPPDGVAWPQSTAEVSAVLALCHEHRTPVLAFGTGSSLEGHVLAVARRPLARHDADGRDPRDQRRRPRLPRAGRRPSRGARPGARRARPALRRGPGCRRDARRDGGDRRLGHDDGPLREHARPRARARGGARRRHGDPHRLARAQVGGRLRPDEPARRLRGHARRDHRAPAARASGAGADRRGALLVRDDRRARGGRDRHRARRRAGRALRPDRRARDPRGQRALGDEPAGDADAVPRVPRRARRGRRGGGEPRARSRPSTAAASSRGPRRRRSARRCGVRATRPTSPGLQLRPGARRLHDRRLRADLRARPS